MLREGQSTCTDLGRLGRVTLISVVGTDDGISRKDRCHGTTWSRVAVYGADSDGVVSDNILIRGRSFRWIASISSQEELHDPIEAFSSDKGEESVCGQSRDRFE